MLNPVCKTFKATTSAQEERTMSSAFLQLQRHFGNNLDKEVLESVLEMCGGDLQQAIQFLEIQNNDTQQVQAYERHVKQASSSSSPILPPNYHDKPANWMPIRKDAVEKCDGHLASALRFRTVFLEEVSLEQHFKFQLDAKECPFYTSVLLILLYQGVELSHVTKSRILAGFLARRQYALADYLLHKYDKQFGLIEVLRALKILDAPRRIQCIEKKIGKLTGAKKRTVNKLKGQINDVKQDMVPNELMKTSVSGALAKHMRKWCQTISRDQLQFFALHLPKEPWQELADLIHCNPSKDFQLDYFLKVSFGETAPQDSIIEACKSMSSSNLLSIVQKYQVPYSYLRKQVPHMSPEVRICVANYESLETVIWWYEELTAGGVPQIDQIITERLVKGQVPTFGYGKLMERLQLFKHCGASFYNLLLPIAESKLKSYRLPLEPVVVVAGDASFSMDVAIRTSTIISSVVVALTNDAELKFFNVRAYDAPLLPKSAAQVLELSSTSKADGLTAPACLLWEYYTKKRPIKLFIMVTDEIENEKFNNWYFAQLFYKYYTEIYAAKIMFISFVENPNTQTKGRMAISLEQLGIQPIVFTLDGTRPDLTKLDKIIGILSSETNFFGVQVEYLATSLSTKQIDNAIKDIDHLPQPIALTQSQTLAAADDNQSLVRNDEPPKSLGTSAAPHVGALDPDGIPHEFLCPITQEVMKEPVICADGYTYEKDALAEWFKTKDLSPMTGQKVDMKIVFPNFTLRSRIKEFLDRKQ